jgi:hypothetical protein
MDFEERLQKAIQRGQRRHEAAREELREKAISEEDLKNLHGQYRLLLSEHIENCVQRLPNYFPGFQYETIFGERGWGGACSRDDIHIEPGGRRTKDYSRLELTIRPFSKLHILELAGKGTIRNKEIFNRTHYERIENADTTQFQELIDVWVLEYVERFAAQT